MAIVLIVVGGIDASGHLLDSVVDMEMMPNNEKVVFLHIPQMEVQPEAGCPIVSMVVWDKKVAPPHSESDTLDCHGVGHGSDSMGLIAQAPNGPSVVKVRLLWVEVVLSWIIQLPLQQSIG